MKLTTVAIVLVLTVLYPVVAFAETKLPSLEELRSYAVDCKLKEKQLAHLRQIQKIKNFNSDPDTLDAYDRAYNSRLKSTIWWFYFGCEK
jgi:hypothetical protein